MTWATSQKHNREPYGWSYSLLPWRSNVEEGIRLLSEHGFRLCETGEAAVLADPDRFSDSLARCGVEVSSVYAFLPFGRLERLREIIWHHGRLAQAMSRCGCSYVVLGPGDILRGVPEYEDIHRFVRLTAETAARYRAAGIRVGIHPHAGSPLYAESSVDMAMALLPPDIDLVPDFRHLTEAGIELLPLLRRYLERIRLIHAKDVTLHAAEVYGMARTGMSLSRRRASPCELGDGDLPLPEIWSFLGAAGFQGTVTIEDEQTGMKPEQRLRQSADYIHKKRITVKPELWRKGKEVSEMVVRIDLDSTSPWQTDYVRDRVFYLSEHIGSVTFNGTTLEVEYSGDDDAAFRDKLNALIDESRRVRIIPKKRLKDSLVEIEEALPVSGYAPAPDGGLHLHGEVALLPAALERLFRDKLGPAGIVLRKYPSMMSRDIMTKSKYPVHFPQNIYRVAELSHDIERITAFHESGGTRDDLYRPTDFYMQPCVCFQVYNELGGLGEECPGNVVFSAAGRCFRHEHRSRIDAVRGLEFDMHEFVFIGDSSFVRQTRDELTERTWELFGELGFAGYVETASDHFFHHVDVGKTLFQLAGELKYELRFSANSGVDCSLASFNLFGDVLCSSFGIRSGEQVLHSGCAAYGIDRWIQALLLRYGNRSSDWPTPIRVRM